MSLVNDMLKDLEAGKRRSLPEGVSSTPLNENKHRLGALPLVSLIALLAFVPVAFYLGLNWQGSDSPVPPNDSESVKTATHGDRRSDSVSTASSPTAGQEPGAKQAAMHEFLPDEQPGLAARSEDKPGEHWEPARLSEDQGFVTDVSTSNSLKVDRLLDAAELALREDRLTSPLDDNAFTRYQTVLLLEPSHPQAVQGITKIAERYLEFYGTKARAGDMQAANVYLEKAQQVVRRYPQLVLWLNQRAGRLAEEIAEAKKAEGQHETAASQQLAGESTAVAGTAEARGDAPEGQAVRRSPSKSEVDKRVAAQAQTLMQQRRYAQAQSLLMAHLEHNPEAPAVRKALFDAYIASDNLLAAQQQLRQLTDLPTHEQAQMKARIKAQEGDLPAAVLELESASPTVADVPAYYSYLAALYHKTKRYDDAAELYRRLLNADDSQPTYWLGLAVSLDALDDRPGALRAFRYARRYSKPDAPSRAYVEERIRHLAG